MQRPDWAVNELKYARAIAQCGATASEESLQKAYRSYGGLIKEESKVTSVSPEKKPVVEPKPVKTKKAKKK